ncbi:hypothetical protein LCGC14_1428580 [marine sediment metagenome]|uniref:Uncharacterized protein n=1 Tax=marine sediment metagenome TaxID=412755 RepID=A0A0F9JPK4_9ZZZZ
MKTLILSFLIISLSLFILGCGEETSHVINTFEVKKDIEDSRIKLEENMGDMGKNTNSISKEAITIKNKSQEGLLVSAPETDIYQLFDEIKTSSALILMETDSLQNVKNNLSLVQSNLQIVESKVDEMTDNSKILKKERDEAIKERDKLQDDLKSGMAKLLRFIIGGCIIGIGIFGALAAFGNIKGGIFGAAGCGITLVLAIVVGQHVVLIGWIGLAIVLFGIGLAAYHIYTQRRALHEVILTTEEVKKDLPVETKNKIFGINPDLGIAGRLQSALTKTIVQKEREKINK